MKEVILPQLGEGIEGASITCWYFKPGDNVKEGEDLVELATDKAAFNLPCPASGKLSRVLLSEGEAVKVGQALATIEEEPS